MGEIRRLRRRSGYRTGPAPIEQESGFVTLRDARELEDGAAIGGDLCIVGAGAAGISIARAFAGTRVRVCLLEGGGLEFEEAIQDLFKGEDVGRRYFDLDACRLRFFGGTTNHWEGRCRPLDAIDFETRDWVPHSGWAIARADLDPFYPQAQKLCQLGPLQYAGQDWLRAGETLIPFAPDRFRNLIWQYSPPTRFGEVYRPELARADNLDVVLHANVIDIDANEAGSQVRALRLATLDGKRFQARAKVYVLACGGLENPRLLLAANRQIPDGLGNARGVVGRYFMEHLHIVAARVLVGDPREIDFSDYDHRLTPTRGHGVVGCMNLSPETQRAERLLNYDANVTEDNVGASGYAALRRIWNALQAHATPQDLFGDLKTALLDIDDTFAGLAGRFGLREYQPTAGSFRLWSFCEQAPDPDSRITLSRERDALGMPRIKLDWRLAEPNKTSLRRTVEVLAQEFGRTGTGRIQLQEWLLEPSNRWSDELVGGFHPMGTTRMAANPAEGVVDRDCRVHGIANLYVAGSSTFATAGTANPTLTIVALALRLAEHLRTELTA
jgi:choline dehydrogenase-like flavoprotein